MPIRVPLPEEGTGSCRPAGEVVVAREPMGRLWVGLSCRLLLDTGMTRLGGMGVGREPS